MTTPQLPIGLALRDILTFPRRAQASTRRPVANFVVRSVGKAALDFTLTTVAFLIATGLEDGPFALGATSALTLAAAAGLLLVAAHAAQGSYRSIWRYTSFREVATVSLSVLFVLATLLVLHGFALITAPAVTLVLGSLLSLFLVLGVRAGRRWQRMAAKRQRQAQGAGVVRKRVLIAGAGDHGLSIARDLIATPSSGVEVVGFVDDDREKIGAAVGPARVLGPLSEALALAERHDVSEVIVAMPSTDPQIVRAFVQRVEGTGMRVRTLSGVQRFVSGQRLHRPGSTTADDLLKGSLGIVRPHGERGKRVLVTGGAGFVGSHLTRMLLDRGYHVRVLDRFDYGRAGLETIMHPRLEIQQGDICSSRDVSRALRDVDSVLALAAIVGDPACNVDPDETINLNYTATKILVDACNLYGVRRLVFASSCSVYGASAHEDDLLTERSRLNPVSLYARTRVLSENILFDNAGDVEPVVLRLATVFGLSPRMRFDLVVNTLTVRAVVDGKIAVFGGNQWRPNVHCRDVAKAFITALEAPASVAAGEIFNVGGNGQNHRIAELGRMVADIVGDVTVEQRDEVTDPRNYRVDFTKIRTMLGFEPEFTVAMGIEEVAAAVRAHAHLQHYQNPVFHNVQAIKQSLTTPRRRREDYAPSVASVASAPSALAV